MFRLRPSLFLGLIALWGLSNAFSIAEIETDDDASTAAVSKNVNDLRFLHFETPESYSTIDFNDKVSLDSANIKSDRGLVVLIDGFLSNSTSPMTTLLKRSYVQQDQYNLIVLDWGKLSGSEASVDNALKMAAVYLNVIGNVQPIGQRLGQFLELIAESKGIPLSEITVIGGSLGAHIAGACGTYIRKKYGEARLGYIVGLDPGGLNFSLELDRDKRLSKGDAGFVAMYHSNRGGLGDSALDTGDINVFCNGGNHQPGCEEADLANSGVCSHAYAFKLYNVAFVENIRACPCSGFFACTCETCSYECDDSIQLGPVIASSARGNYYVSHGAL